MDNTALTRAQMVDAIMYSTNHILSPEIADQLITRVD